jgi:hypothetical protein
MLLNLRDANNIIYFQLLSTIGYNLGGTCYIMRVSFPYYWIHFQRGTAHMNLTQS